MEIRTYGLYIVKDNFSEGRVTGFMPYPSDIAAAYGFKKFVEDKEKMCMFPLPKRLELVRVCKIDQLTDCVVVGNNDFDCSICTAETVQSYINSFMEEKDV